LGSAPAFAVARIAPSDAAKVLPSRDGVVVKARMRRSFGFDPM
jgi:hypothetical protein